MDVQPASHYTITVSLHLEQAEHFTHTFLFVIAKVIVIIIITSAT